MSNTNLTEAKDGFEIVFCVVAEKDELQNGKQPGSATIDRGNAREETIDNEPVIELKAKSHQVIDRTYRASEGNKIELSINAKKNAKKYAKEIDENTITKE